MRDKTKSRTIKYNKWERTKYTEQSKRDTAIIKNIIKIRDLKNIPDFKQNYWKDEEQPLCQLYEEQDDKTEHVL